MTMSLLKLSLILLSLMCAVNGAPDPRRPVSPYEPPDPTVEPVQAARLQQEWTSMAPGLHGCVGSIDTRYRRDEPPRSEQAATAWSGVAWRGERLNAQFVLWSAGPQSQLRCAVTDLRGPNGASLGRGAARLNFVRYVLADGKLAPDVLDTADRLEMPARTARPIWMRLDVPHEAPAGRYMGRVAIEAAGGASCSIALTVDVLPLTLPAPVDWKFHLDLWQNPYSVARYHHVPLWSNEHFRLLKPHLRMLADAGQKCLTTTILYQPWGTQTYDPYGSMVDWIRRADGTWRFDYAVFDRYVEFGAHCGLDGAINCYSMVPWSNTIRFLDERTGDYVDQKVTPGTPEFAGLWRPFLVDFVKHLRAHGWLGRAAIAMDERPPELMRPTIALVHEAAPGLKIALAGDNQPGLKEAIDDWCVYVTPPLDEAIVHERRVAQRPTTFYVCCNPERPNTFTASPPAEAAWMGWYAASKGFTGFLRWAYDCWVEDPLYDTSHVTWPAGDCFLVYPGGRSSIRFERLREGIQDYEKLRLLRASSALRGLPEMAALETALARFSFEEAGREPAADCVNPAKQALERLAVAAAAHDARLAGR